jgi:branched-chain amino acid transport system permease protein
MDLFFQVFVNSLVIGSLYGAIAMSFALAYRTTRFFNLAHGSMAAIGGYMFFWMRDSFGAGIFISLPAGILAAGIAGFLIDRFIYAPQRQRKASSTVLLVVSLGVVTVIEAVLSMMFGPQFRPLVTSGQISSFQVGPVFITQVQIWIIAVNLLIFGGLIALLYKSKFGRMIRAIADDADVARTLGIRSDFYIGIVFFIAAAIAGLVGILNGLDTGLQPVMGFYLLLKGIVASIIGGVGSIPGALLGGLLLAVVENAGVFTIGSEWRDAIAFVLLLVFLALRPQGILGKEGK